VVQEETPADVQIRVVEIKDFVIRKKDNGFTVNFNLLNVSKNKSVSGYTHIIAIQKAEDTTRNWSYPKETLSHGLPANFRRGQPFIIQRYKPIEGRFKLDPVVGYPSLLKILVYNQAGELILKNEFDFNNNS